MVKTLVLAGFLGLGALLPYWIVRRHYGPRIFPPAGVPAAGIAIVFGAGLRRDGTPTLVLADRVETGAWLYREGKVQKLLMSGSSTGPHYDEPGAMRELAIRLGVAEEDIVVDRGGNRTYLTCSRAMRLFGISEAVLVSQAFHLPRALAICDALGMKAFGAVADMSAYGRRVQGIWNLREIPATLVALWESYVREQAPSSR
jgi:vancomycin permeability regulator SanA